MGIKGDVLKFQQSMEAMGQSICPTSLSIHLSRIDSRAKHPHSTIYDADRICFRVMRERAFIRAALTGEFDYTPSNRATMETFPALQFQNVSLPSDVLRSLWKSVPRLWVLVTDLGDGTHHVSTIYRGDAVWKVKDIEGSDVAYFKSSKELLEALEAIQACEGLDIAAWKRFVQKYWDASVIDAAVVDTKGKAVN